MVEMRRASPYPLLPIEEAQRIIAAHSAALPAEQMGIALADGRVLAEDVLAAEPMPDRAKSALDGYALRADDGASVRRIVGELTAGGAGELVVTAGAAVRIMTGTPMPPGADAMIPVELTEEREGQLHVARSVQSGENVHRVGQDLGAGQLVLRRGSALGAAEIGLLAMVGRSAVAVYRRPLVAVLATGDELYELGAQPIAGGVYDSNRYALLAAAREAGAETRSLGIARDELAVQRTAILDALAWADVFVSSGGVSMGSRDLIKPLLAELGTVHVGRVNFKPGKPTTFATIAREGRAPLLAFGLPGFPVSSLVSFEVFVRPTLRMLQGDSHPQRPRIRIVSADTITPAPDRPSYQRANIAWAHDRLIAHTTGEQGSSRLLSLRGANALLIVPPGSAPLPAGAELEAMLIGSLWKSEV